MSDINKFTSKEVLNKVLLDSSGNAVEAFSHTTQEALNAALDTTNNRLNVSLAGGTISGDVTISGDLTVNGSATNSYDEIVNGQLVAFRDDSSTVGTNDNIVIENDGAGDASLKFSLTGATDWFAYVDNSDSDRFKIRRSTSDYLALSESGNVGIGSDTSSKLTVVTTSDTDGTPTSYGDKFFTVGEGGTTGGNVFISYDQTNNRGYIGALTPGTAWRNLILNPGGGNVGIRKSTLESTDSNWVSLELGGNGALINHSASGAGKALIVSQNAYMVSNNFNTGMDYMDTDEASCYLQHSGTHTFRVTGSGTADASITWTDALAIANDGSATFSGKIGIGTSGTPTQPLHIAHATDATIQLERVDTSVADGDGIGAIIFRGGESSQTDIGRIRVNADADFTSSSSPTKMVFETTPSGSTVDAVALTIDSSQNATFSQNVTIGSGGTTPDLIFNEGDSQITGPLNANFLIKSRGNGADEGVSIQGADGVGLLINKAGDATFGGDVTVSGGDMTLTGTTTSIIGEQSAGANRGKIKFVTSGSDGDIVFETTTNGAGAITEAMRIAHDGSATFTQTVDGDAYIALDNVAGAGSSVNETAALRLNLGDGSTIRGGAKITAKKEADFSTGANMDASLTFSVLENNGYNNALVIAPSGDATFGGDVSIDKSSDGGDSSLTINNSASHGSSDETASLKFQQAGYTGGKIVSNRAFNYSSAGNRDSTLQFYTSQDATDTLAMTIDANQNATFAGTINANAGINFPDSQVASSDVNTLDDYEEGVHTVSGTDDSGTFTLQSGGDTLSYTKIGRQVTVAGELQINDLSGVGGGGLRFSLPFAVADQTETGDRFVGTVQTRNVDFSADVVSACVKAVVGTQYFFVVELTDNGMESALSAGSFATNDEVTITLTYFTS